MDDIHYQRRALDGLAEAEVKNIMDDKIKKKFKLELYDASISFSQPNLMISPNMNMKTLRNTSKYANTLWKAKEVGAKNLRRRGLFFEMGGNSTFRLTQPK